MMIRFGYVISCLQDSLHHLVWSIDYKTKNDENDEIYDNSSLGMKNQDEYLIENEDDLLSRLEEESRSILISESSSILQKWSWPGTKISKNEEEVNHQDASKASELVASDSSASENELMVEQQEVPQQDPQDLENHAAIDWDSDLVKRGLLKAANVNQKFTTKEQIEQGLIGLVEAGMGSYLWWRDSDLYAEHAYTPYLCWNGMYHERSEDFIDETKALVNKIMSPKVKDKANSKNSKSLPHGISDFDLLSSQNFQNSIGVGYIGDHPKQYSQAPLDLNNDVAFLRSLPSNCRYKAPMVRITNHQDPIIWEYKPSKEGRDRMREMPEVKSYDYGGVHFHNREHRVHYFHRKKTNLRGGNVPDPADMNASVVDIAKSEVLYPETIDSDSERNTIPQNRIVTDTVSDIKMMTSGLLSDTTIETKSFRLAIISDPQFGFHANAVIGACEQKTNTEMRYDIEDVMIKNDGSTNYPFLGLVIAGDLTNTEDTNQWGEFVTVYGGIYDSDGEVLRTSSVTVVIPVYPQLGNHDYETYCLTNRDHKFLVWPPFYWPAKWSGACEYMVGVMRGLLNQGRPDNKRSDNDPPIILPSLGDIYSFHRESISYSFYPTREMKQHNLQHNDPNDNDPNDDPPKGIHHNERNDDPPKGPRMSLRNSRLRFFMLHSYPTYTSSCRQIDDAHRNDAIDCVAHDHIEQASLGLKQSVFPLESSLPWLKGELEEMCGNDNDNEQNKNEQQKYAILVMHDFGSAFCNPNTLMEWQKEECKSFLQVIAGSCVIAIFSGFTHSDIGREDVGNNREGREELVGNSKNSPITPDLSKFSITSNPFSIIRNKWGQEIVSIKVGSVQYRTWLELGVNLDVTHNTNDSNTPDSTSNTSPIAGCYLSYRSMYRKYPLKEKMLAKERTLGREEMDKLRTRYGGWEAIYEKQLLPEEMMSTPSLSGKTPTSSIIENIEIARIPRNIEGFEGRIELKDC